MKTPHSFNLYIPALYMRSLKNMIWSVRCSHSLRSFQSGNTSSA
jgi:hypothetical protein